ncbi:serine/threonine-protein kinase pdik1l-B [Alosa sapidissima]|uniref:serine/threonine-protein kinase pdik1l-B n=1 Tax=Alosa sapidissima TaxID=34773 RepID=UPI001C08623C|nr:serine/threonine-protein kinase pdik1l-B [Alosa sapidissima]XP_041952017.1 serine/threonine-protein kinase pdik1l-B [Alosa sapidissima]
MEELYILQREVGRGSYGVVFEGLEKGAGDRVAIKRLPCISPEGIQLYLQELWVMRTTAENHPNVIALHSCLAQTGPNTLQLLKPGRLPLDLVESALKGALASGQKHSTKGTNSRSRKRPMQPRAEVVPRRCSALWLVMEYCEGGDLNHYMLSRPPDTERNHSVLKQLSSAMTFLHVLGIVHRDLKPDNVLVQLTKKGPVIKVADFGLSKITERLSEGDQTRPAFSSTCGSDFYMAPEVWAGRNYTAQADIFSMGVLFWAVLERITFLEDGSTHEQLGAYFVRGRWLTPLGEALCQNPDLQLVIPMKGRRAPPLPPPPNPAVCTLLLHMLASDPDARPSAQQLEGYLRHALKQH